MSNSPSFFIDEPELVNLVLDFPNYTGALSDLILNSKPRYTIGIFGTWGSGKTTLMKNVESVLVKNGCGCFEFSAWRYALEERHATYPLMLEMITRILEVDTVKLGSGSTLDKIKKNAIRIAKGLKITAGVNLGVANLSVEADGSEMMKSNGEDEKLRESKSLFQQGLETINELLQYIKGPEVNPDLKLVIFIDDLDRCTPEKVTEVFESLKIFFDIEGIVFVLGLSHEIVEEAINQHYKIFGSIFSGKDYLKKIIQVPFPLPTWSQGDIVEYLKSLIANHKDDTYKNFLNENLGLVAKAVEHNPREVKRLLNNFILSHQIHKNDSRIDKKKLFIIHVIAHRWRDFYEYIMKYPNEIKTMIDEYNEIESKSIDAASPDEPEAYQSTFDDLMKKNNRLNDFKNIHSIMNFLNEIHDNIIQMKEEEFRLYRRATIIEPELDLLKEVKHVKKIPMIKIELIPIEISHDEQRKFRSEFWRYGGTRQQGKSPRSLAESIEVDVDSTGVIKFRYYVPVNFRTSNTSHTSDLILHINLDGLNIGTTQRLGHVNQTVVRPLDTGGFMITNLSIGKHFLTLQPEIPEDEAGEFLDNWGGIVDFY